MGFAVRSLRPRSRPVRDLAPPPVLDDARLSPAERVTRAIAALLERGVRPWVRPWSDDRADVGALELPLRSCGTPYRGMNIVALWAATLERGYRARRWFTFKQALALDACVRKGERGSFVVFYTELGEKPGEEDAPPPVSGGADPDGRPSKRRILRGYVVFNADRIDGLPPEHLEDHATYIDGWAQSAERRSERVP